MRLRADVALDAMITRVKAESDKLKAMALNHPHPSQSPDRRLLKISNNLKSLIK